MSGIQLVQPPTLRTDEDRSATPLELFFDLAYVLVIAELAVDLLHDLSWHGALEFAGIFALIWYSWCGFTLYTNRFHTDDVVFRIAKLAATAAIAGCAASVHAATGELFVAFTVSYLLGRLLLLLLYVRAFRHVHDARSTAAVYLVAASGSAVVWGVSLLVPEPARYFLWAAVILIDTLAPVIATRHGDLAPLHMEHLPERFGLLVILVLGEVVGAVVTGLHETEWARTPVVLAVAGFALACALWWNYFDVGGAVGQEELSHAAEEEADSADASGPQPVKEEQTGLKLDWFIYGHLPLTMGITVAGVGLEHLVTHPDEHGPNPAVWALALGLLGFWLGATAIVGGTRQRWREALVWPALFLLLPVIVAFIPMRSGGYIWVLTAVTVVAAALGTALLRRQNDVHG